MDAVEVPADEFGVWPENEEAVTVFIYCASQWRYRSDGRRDIRAGLDYNAVEAVMRMRKTEDQMAVFDDVRIMEFAVLEAINQQG